MAVRQNGLYYDPAFSTAFDNLAEAFSGPKATDVLAYAKAGAEKQKASRLQYLFDNPNDPNFDRRNVAAGNYTPIQSYYAQDQNNATDLKKNAATNAANIQFGREKNASDLALERAKPVLVTDGTTAYLPPEEATARGLPGMFRGNITAKPGDIVATPGGEVISGAPKPLTDSEVRGAILQDLPQNEKRAAALQGVGTTNVVGKDGNPVVSFTPDAVGKQAYVKDNSKPTVANYKRPDGSVGSASLADDGRWIDTQTKEVLPAGIQTYSANLQGDKDATGLGASTKNSVEGQLVDLALTDQTSKRLRDIVTKNPGAQGLVGAIRGTVQDVLAAGGEVGQLFDVNMKKMQEDIAAGRVDPAVVAKFSKFDPNIPAVNMLETLLTAQVAKVLDPNGRISNDRYEQVAKALGAGGMTGNSQRTIATLDQLDRIITDRRALLSPAAPGAAKIGQAAIPPTPATPASAAPATPTVRTWNPATGQLE
ncbi:hypothetical protein [Bradyrhizobium sp.]|jgi:hypothetical protein|uniref:hypothetical protein n=1 Tax=Bradyrhizobium sp. TaxID=376 RepID=UPI002DDDB87B|nr:hypothetical protein [Bradyrhizobium sp.]HEV2155403.1 hypothetical protein [Bradyrhizobium sp.]